MVARALCLFVLGCGIAIGCSGHARERLPPLDAPALTALEEPIYLRAQVERYMRDLAAERGRDFDFRKHVDSQFYFMQWDLMAWEDRTVGLRDQWMDTELKRDLLARTPEIQEFQGCRENAVAMGLLALSLWRREPPKTSPSIEDLRICTHARPQSKKCPFRARTLTLQRMILMAQYADEDLFKALARASAERRARGVVPDEAPQPDREVRGGARE